MEKRPFISMLAAALAISSDDPEPGKLLVIL